MMGWYGHSMGVGAWLFMGLFWAALIGLIAWAVVQLSPRRDRDDGREAESPLEILDRRFASGSIDVETYHAQRDALVAGRGSRR